MFEALRRDAARYRNFGGWVQHLGFWAVAVYRLAAWARAHRVPGLSPALIVLSFALKQPFRLLLHLELPSRARIGPGFALVHPYNVLLGHDVEIGADCTIYHEVTLGLGPVPGEPKVGNAVVIFPGARVLGGVKLGDQVEIGANCVVTRDVPAMSLVVAPLPRIIPRSLVSRCASAARSDGGDHADSPAAREATERMKSTAAP